MKIPIVIGVTGHRNLREADLSKLRESVSNELARLMAAYPHSEFVMLNSIASGADSLCAQIALELGIRLVCPLPMEAREYRRDFSGEDAAVFDRLLQSADEVFVAPDAEPQVDTRDFHYRQAGIYVAAHSHVLLALWDGNPAQAGGCGTAEAVDFALAGTSCGNHLRPANDGAVLHVYTPRADADGAAAGSVRRIENEDGALESVLRVTDDFNSDSDAVRTEDGAELLPRQAFRGRDRALDKLHDIFQTSDALSVAFQEKYLRAIRLFSLCGVLLVLSFLLYDELESNLFLLAYGAVIAVYALTFIRVRNGKHHERYLQYRVLSEVLRVQFYLRASGMSESVADSFTWTQKQESTWIREAVAVLLIGGRPNDSVPIKQIQETWIEGQLGYHKKAYQRDFRSYRKSESIARILMLASVLIFLLTLALEFFAVPLMEAVLSNAYPLMSQTQSALRLRSLIKIVLGGISAITVFLTNYYGKLSLERKSIDHTKMAALYAQASAQFDGGRMPPEQLFLQLAREEIIECGNWFSYCHENPPTFNI